MDYYQLLVQGPGVEWTIKQFAHLSARVVTWLTNKGQIKEAETTTAEEILEDLINVSCPETEKTRTQILAKVNGDKNSSSKLLWGLREAVLEGVRARRHEDYQRQIYSQVSRSVLILEDQGQLVSTTAIKRMEPLRTILRLMRVGHSNEEIADQLNVNGSRQVDGAAWTPKSVSKLITQYRNPTKRIGLAKWGDAWLSKIPENTLEACRHSLPLIPGYRGGTVHNRNQSKLFNYSILKTFILATLENYGAALTLGGIAKAVEGCISPPLFSNSKETAWPEAGFIAEKAEHRPKFSAADYLACSVSSCEEELHTRDAIEKLMLVVEPRERIIFEGLRKGKSKRKLATICGCASGTIEEIRLSLQTKAARLDPVVRVRAEQIRSKEGKKVSRKRKR